jgi:glucose/mannose-6-phosphate isomerase
MPVATLDDRAVIAAADPGGMLGFIAGMGGQLRKGFQLGAAVPSPPPAQGTQAVVVCGMGGSGIAGDVARSVFAAESPVPIVVSKGFQLPGWCRSDSFVIAVSFSGDTEETVTAYEEAVVRGCRVATVSAGGRLEDASASNRTPHVPIPNDVPMPRAAVGYLAAGVIGLLSATGLFPDAGKTVTTTADALDLLADRVGPGRPTPENEAKGVAAMVADRIALVWTSEGPAEAAALRWKTQLNENAKMPAFHSILPELDHNEIEGMAAADAGQFGVLVLRHRLEHPRVAARVEATLEVLGGSGLEVREVWGSGATPLEVVFWLLMLGDFASVYAAVLRGVDPTPVPVLMGLKERLRR